MNRLTKTVGTLSLVGCAVIVSPCAVADDSGWYMGGNVGRSQAKIDDARITSSLAGFTATAITDDNSNTGYKLFGGYKFNPHFALEGGYFDLGKFGFTATTALPAGTLSGNTKLGGINLDAVGILPITEKFSAFGRFGLNYAEARDNFTSSGAVPAQTNISPTKHAANPKAGLGLQYDFTQSLGMRAEVERYRINDAVGNKGDIDLVSFGLVYRFGVKKPAPAPAPKAAALEPVTAPAPQPVVVMPPILPPVLQSVAVVPPPAVRKVIFSTDSSTDSLFDFGKATISPVGQQALDKFAADLKDANFDVITVTGHTDRIGSFAYNMKLSKRRAEAVMAYLVESTGIPSDKIAARGMGDSDPVTKPGECKGTKETKKLITCLGPDQRVEVEVSATRTSNETAAALTTQ